MHYTFSASLRSESNRRGYYTHFTVPPEITEEILEVAEGMLRGWRSVRVEALVGATRFQTSIFPFPGVDGYILPVRKAVRVSAGLVEGEAVDVHLTLRDF